MLFAGVEWEVCVVTSEASISRHLSVEFASCLLHDVTISCTSPYSSAGWDSIVLKIGLGFRLSHFSAFFENSYSSKMVDRLGKYL